jgi:hypothetical protein
MNINKGSMVYKFIILFHKYPPRNYCTFLFRLLVNSAILITGVIISPAIIYAASISAYILVCIIISPLILLADYIYHTFVLRSGFIYDYEIHFSIMLGYNIVTVCIIILFNYKHIIKRFLNYITPYLNICGDIKYINKKD